MPIATSISAVGVAALVAAGAVLLQVVFTLVRALARPAGEVWSEPLVPGAAPEQGVRYYLPRTVLRVVVNYTVTESRVYEYGIAGPPTAVRVRVRSVQVEPRVTPDLLHPIRVRGKGGATADVNQAIVLSDDGLLQSVNTTVTDRTAEVFESVVGAAGRLAVLGAGLAAAGAPVATAHKVAETLNPAATEAERVADRREALHAALDAAYADLVKKSTAGADPAQLTLVQGQITVLLMALREFEAGNGVKDLDRDLSQEQIIDPAESIAAPRVIELKDPATGRVVAKLEMTLEGADGVPPDPLAVHPAAEETEGIVHLVPRPVRTRMKVPGAADVVFDQVIPVAQFGRLAVLRTSSGRLESVVTAAKFSQQTGGLKEFSRQSTSSAAAAASKLSASADALAKNIEEARKKTGDAAELERLQLQTRLAVARAKRDKARDPTAAATMTV